MEPRIFTPTPIDVNDRGHCSRSGSPVTNNPCASGFLLILTYYFKATVTPGGGGGGGASIHIFRKVYLSLCIFNYGYKTNYIINLSGTALV